MLIKSKSLSKKLFCVIFLTIYLIISTVSFSLAAYPENWPKSITIATGVMGGPVPPSGAKFSEILMETYPELSVTCIESGGTGALKIVNGGIDAQIGAGHIPLYYLARAGKLPEDNKQYLDSRLGLPLLESLLQISVPANSNIYSIEDLIDKRINIGTRAGTTSLVAEAVLKAHGFDYDTIIKNGGKVLTLDFGQGAGAMIDGHVDAMFVIGDIPHSSMIEVQSRLPLRLIPLEEDKIEAVLKEFPGLYTKNIPPEIFKGTKDSVKALAIALVWVAHKSLPEDFMYEVTKLYMNEAPEIKEHMATIANLWAQGWEVGTLGMGKNEMHPGILRAYQEAGFFQN